MRAGSPVFSVEASRETSHTYHPFSHDFQVYLASTDQGKRRGVPGACGTSIGNACSSVMEWYATTRRVFGPFRNRDALFVVLGSNRPSKLLCHCQAKGEWPDAVDLADTSWEQSVVDAGATGACVLPASVHAPRSVDSHAGRADRGVLGTSPDGATSRGWTWRWGCRAKRAFLPGTSTRRSSQHFAV